MDSVVSGSTIGLTLMLLAISLGDASKIIDYKAPDNANFLREIANRYYAPLAVSFLHTRIQKNEQMISKIGASLAGLDQSKRDTYELAKKSLQLLDEQLTLLEKADYFDFDGTERVKYFIEQYIVLNEMYPIKLGSYGVAESPDRLLEDSTSMLPDAWTNVTNNMIETYLTDIDEKVLGCDINRLQKLAASTAKRELKLLTNYVFMSDLPYRSYAPPTGTISTQAVTVLRKIETIADFFYSQFNYLADPKSREKMKSSNANKEITSPNLPRNEIFTDRSVESIRSEAYMRENSTEDNLERVMRNPWKTIILDKK